MARGSKQYAVKAFYSNPQGLVVKGISFSVFDDESDNLSFIHFKAIHACFSLEDDDEVFLGYLINPTSDYLDKVGSAVRDCPIFKVNCDFKGDK